MKNVLLLLIIIVVFASCKGRPSVGMQQQARIDDSLIRVYLAANPSVKAVKDTLGLYYQIIQQGTGKKPVASSMVTVNYSVRILNGPKVEAGDGLNSKLTALVEGWQLGLPHLKTGGSILLIVPSALGYGAANVGPIPASSVLLFNIDLTDCK